MTETISVTVTVRTSDVDDVLQWHDWPELEWDGRVIKDMNRRWLELAQRFTAPGERRQAIFQSMPPSLQWAVHEYEHRGPWRLHALHVQAQHDGIMDALEEAAKSRRELIAAVRDSIEYLLAHDIDTVPNGRLAARTVQHAFTRFENTVTETNPK